MERIFRGIMCNITDYILKTTDKLSLKEENAANGKTFLQFNSGSVEVEVAEFLYSFTRLIKPKLVVETGTHKGISALYIALALEKNNQGKIKTFEVIGPLQKDAKALCKDFNIYNVFFELSLICS